MPLTRDFRQSVVERVHRDPAFAMALLDKAATLYSNGEPQTARLILRDLVNATVGFEGLAAATDKPAKSLHRMLSPKGNPSMDNLAAIFCAVRKNLGWISRLTRSKQREVDENRSLFAKIFGDFCAQRSSLPQPSAPPIIHMPRRWCRSRRTAPICR